MAERACHAFAFTTRFGLTQALGANGIFAVINPWIDLPTAGPLVLASDAPLLHAFNSRAQPRHRYDLSLYPEPYFGSPRAFVVLLNLNPGWSEDDATVHASTEFAAMSRASLTHSLMPYPFLHLQPSATTPGGRWWHQRARRLIADVGFDVVARGLACIQFTPYHSEQYASDSPSIPSQQYSFHLVREAMARQAEIVVMRSWKLWVGAIPELASYGRVHRASNPRAPYISPGNLKSSYETIVSRLRRGA